MIAQFSLRLLLGMALMWAVMPRGQVTSGFFRIQMLVALGLSVLAALTIGGLTGELPTGTARLPTGIALALCIVLGAAAFLGSVLWTLERRRAGTVVVFLIAGLSLPTLLLSVVPAETLGSSAGWLHLFSEISAASMLGGATTGMLLGHWYLTTPMMSIEPLKRLTLYFGIAGVGRLLLSAIGLALAWEQLAGPTHGLWLALRWGAGVIGPLVVAVMVWRILKYRNTQSATGVLFVGVILTFLGEMTALLLYRDLGVPL